ncbi:MAG: hypothetical protein KGL91_10350 [Xanthomonadaceae bacterium]|nr:hypothetical protein [Xanthomonadaceae bacterium]
MQIRTLSLALAASLVMAASFTTSASILFQNLGTAAPPTTIGGHTMQPFDQAAQNAIPDGGTVVSIPGSPIPGTLSLSASATKYPFWALNATWGHGYSGPLFTAPNNTTFTLPPNTQAFYLYAMGNAYGPATITVTSDSGSSSGATPVTVNALGGPDSANGFAFYSTAGETISSVTVSTSVSGGFIFAEFGINGGPITTCASSGYTGTQLLWCQKICESGLTGKDLDVWLQRWIRQFRQLPYCALPGGNPPPPPPGD